MLLAAAVGWVLTGPAPGLVRLAPRSVVAWSASGRSVRGDETSARPATSLSTAGGRSPERPALGPAPSAAAAFRPVRRRASPRRSAAELTTSIGELLTGLASGLATGAAPREVRADAATGLPGLDALAATARSPTGDVAGALDRLGRRAGGAAAADLALLWRLAERTGCALIGPVQRLRDADRGEASVRRELAAQLAGPRATARLLAGLPLVGVALGAGLGADPLGFLLGTVAGIGCLMVGGVLVAMGLLWTRLLVRSVDPGRAPGRDPSRDAGRHPSRDPSLGRGRAGSGAG